MLGQLATSTPTGASRSCGSGRSVHRAIIADLPSPEWAVDAVRRPRRAPRRAGGPLAAILGANLAGAYVQGSFALGAGDLHSDCDFLVATHEPTTAEQEDALRALHDEIPHPRRALAARHRGLIRPGRRTGAGEDSAGSGSSTTTAIGPGVGRPLQPDLHAVDPARARHHPRRGRTPRSSSTRGPGRRDQG